jgi:hypothetical protein
MDEPRNLEHREDEQEVVLTPGQSRAHAAAHLTAQIAAARAVPEELLSDDPASLTFAQLRGLVESAAYEAASWAACEVLDEAWLGAGK